MIVYRIEVQHTGSEIEFDFHPGPKSEALRQARRLVRDLPKAVVTVFRQYIVDTRSGYAEALRTATMVGRAVEGCEKIAVFVGKKVPTEVDSEDDFHVESGTASPDDPTGQE